MDFLKGKKAYVVAALFLIAFILPAVFSVIVPEWAYAILAALGLSAVRLALADISGNQGWKTYVAAGAVLVIAVLQAVGVVLPFDTIYGLMAALGIVGVRSAVEKLNI